MAKRYGTGTVYPRGKVWWIKYYRDGKPFYESSGSSERKDAVTLLQKRLGEIAANTHPGISPRLVTMGHLFDLVLADYKLHEKRDLPNVKQRIEKQLRPAMGSLPTSSFNRTVLNGYIQRRKNDGKAAATINRELAVLRRALNLGLQADPPLVSRLHKITALKEDNVRTGFLDHADYLRMRELLPDYARLALVIAYHVGCRRGELLQLKWSQVDLKAGKITLKGAQTKTGHGRMLPIYGEMVGWLEMAQTEQRLKYPGCPWVLHRNGLRLRNGFYASWKEAAKEIGLPGLLFHDLRRTAVRNMLDAGVDEKTAMLITGHKTRTMIDRYNIRGERDVMIAAKKIEQFLAAGERKEETKADPPPKAS